jgi:HAD superfamily hydrolase (TIGR01509 family)
LLPGAAFGAFVISESMFSAAIFDMDGLLLDSERPVKDAWQALARQHGASLSDAIYLQCIGKNAPDTDAVLAPVFEGRISYSEACAAVTASLRESLRQGYPVKPGVIDLLTRLRALRVPCAVASSTDRDEVVHRLEKAGLIDFFDSISGGDEVVRGKPNPDLFLLAAQRIAAEPRNCVVFEDSEFGAMGGLAAGMSVVLVPDLKIPAQSVQQQCLMVLTSLEDALQSMDEWFASALRAAGAVA